MTQIMMMTSYKQAEQSSFMFIILTVTFSDKSQEYRIFTEPIFRLNVVAKISVNNSFCSLVDFSSVTQDTKQNRMSR